MQAGQQTFPFLQDCKYQSAKSGGFTASTLLA